MNRALYKNNTSGTSGVYYDKDTKKWGVKIGLNHKRINFGVFTIKKDVRARKETEEKYYKEYSIDNSRKGD